MMKGMIIMQCPLTGSDVIEIVSIITGALLSIISLWIAVKSLKQSQKSIELAELSIEESNRPYVVVYRDFVQVLNTAHEYLVIKNFGNTGATIDSLEISPPYNDSDVNFDDFKNINNTFIAPRQSINSAVFANSANNRRAGITRISIKYHTDCKTYSDVFCINEDIMRDIIISKTNPAKSKTVEEVIVKSAEELLRRNL